MPWQTRSYHARLIQTPPHSSLAIRTAASGRCLVIPFTCVSTNEGPPPSDTQTHIFHARAVKTSVASIPGLVFCMIGMRNSNVSPFWACSALCVALFGVLESKPYRSVQLAASPMGGWPPGLFFLDIGTLQRNDFSPRIGHQRHILVPAHRDPR